MTSEEIAETQRELLTNIVLNIEHLPLAYANPDGSLALSKHVRTNFALEDDDIPGTIDDLDLLLLGTTRHIGSLGTWFRDDTDPLDLLIPYTQKEGVPVLLKVRKEATAGGNLLTMEEILDADTVIDTLTSVMRHESGRHLSRIVLAVDMLSKYLENAPIENKREKYNVIKSEVVSIVQLMDSLRLLGSSNEPLLNTVEAVPAISEIVGRWEREFKGIRQISYQVDQQAFGSKFAVNTSLLESAVNNLIENAAKYSDPIQEIKLRLVVDEGKVIFSVTDYGIGIPESELAEIFAMGYRASNKKDTDGFGIGLFLTKRIVEAMKGKIKVESELGKGTTFSISFTDQNPPEAEGQPL